MKLSLIVVPSAAALLAATSVHAQTPAPPASRAEATAIIAEARKIVTPNGVERLEKVRIGGIDQWVSIRGNDRRNPVLIVLHGGPGYVAMPMSWWFGRGWEEYFTVVHWDQRAAGKTHLLTDSATIAPTLTVDRMIADAEELVAWARKELGKRKVFVMGHSWGSFLGLEMAKRHPEWLHAYIGVGQATNVPESERRGWRMAMDSARRAGNARAVRELEALAPYPPPDGQLTIDDVYAERKWVVHYGGAMAYRRDNAAESALARLSPDYTDEESRRVWEGNAFATPILLPHLLERDLRVGRLDVPLILFLGRHDTNVNAEVAAEWFARVRAPEKHLVWFEHSAHMPMSEEPGKFLISLVRFARPIAERAGDATP
ncbi:MAG TPA: alpha/beta fold hydrolase [Gemmatimonadaceae bacterium]|nr:alpha/beta fold hydrolase [Gemmatimonadaceae bacterium]